MKKLLFIALLMMACAAKQEVPKGPTKLNGYVQPTAEGTLYYHEEIRDGMKFGIWIYDGYKSASMQVVNLTKDSLNCAK
jgi:hypothetical protein